MPFAGLATKPLLQPVPARPRVAGSLRIVAVDDNPDDAELIGLALSDAHLVADIVVVEDEAGLRQALTDGPDVVLCDFNLPCFSPDAALRLIGEMNLRIPLIVVTRAIGEQAAVDVLRRGARDYVQKNHLATLPEVIRRVLKQQAAELEVEASNTRLAVANDRLRELGQRLLGAQERERSRIARELHDVLGQSLTSALMHLEAADRVAGQPTADNYRSTARGVLRDVLDQVRTLSFTLQPPEIERFGLAAALDSSVELLLRPLGIVTRVRVRGDLTGISDTQAAVLYRVVLEAVANTVRHAHPSRVGIRLAQVGGGFTATVADDGDGFDSSELLARRTPRLALGLNSMIERCELVGGKLRIRSRSGRGTVVQARV